MKKILLGAILVLTPLTALAQPGPPPNPWTLNGATVSLFPGNCVTVPSTVTGGCKGPGTINATNFYVNGSLVSGSVASVFGRTGIVSAQTNDYAINQIGGLGTGVGTALGLAVSGTGSICLSSGSACNASGGLTIGSTPISGGTSGRVEFNNAGVLGEKAVTGTGNVVFDTSPTLTSPTLVTPALGTPASGNAANLVGLPISTGVSGLGTGVATALAIAHDTSGGVCTVGGGGCTGAGNALFGTTSGNVANDFVLMSNTTVGVKDGGFAPSVVHIVNGSNPTILASNWANADQYTVIAAGRTFAVPVSTTLSPNGAIDMDANGGAITFTVTSPDVLHFNGAVTGAGGSATLPAWQFYRATTDGGGNVYVSGRDLTSNVNVWTALQKNCVKSLTISGSTFTPDGSCNNYSITLVHASCPCTLANPSVDLSSGGTASGTGWIRFVQSATGNDTIGTWGSNYRISGGTSAITLSTVANAEDVFSIAPISSTQDDLVGPSTNLIH